MTRDKTTFTPRANHGYKTDHPPPCWKVYIIKSTLRTEVTPYLHLRAINDGVRAVQRLHPVHAPAWGVRPLLEHLQRVHPIEGDHGRFQVQLRDSAVTSFRRKSSCSAQVQREKTIPLVGKLGERIGMKDPPSSSYSVQVETGEDNGISRSVREEGRAGGYPNIDGGVDDFVGITCEGVIKHITHTHGRPEHTDSRNRSSILRVYVDTSIYPAQGKLHGYTVQPNRYSAFAKRDYWRHGAGTALQSRT